jgi:hypothetical protein
MTVAEVKSILRITDEYFQEKGTAPKKIANRDASIIQIAGDTNGTTVFTSGDFKTSKSWDDYFIVGPTSTSAFSTGDTIVVNYKLAELDSWIAQMIPIVESDLIDYLNNSFPDIRTRLVTSDLVFTAKTSTAAAKITNAEKLFTSRGYQAGIAIYIEGNGHNQGLKHISSVTDSTLTLSTDDDVYPDTQYAAMYRLSRVNWPDDMKRIIAYIIQYNLIRLKDPGVSNKSVGGVSLGYEPVSGGGYSPSIYAAIVRHKNACLL